MEQFFSQIEPFTMEFMGAGALLVASFTSLFSVVNPIAAVPVFLSVTEDNTDAERRRIARKTTFYMFIILVTFLFAGTYILQFFGISLPGMRIAGGLVVLRSGFSMLNPEKGGRKLTEEDKLAGQEKDDPSFSPLAMPLLSGPGSIAVVIGLGSQALSMMDYIIGAAAVLMCALVAFGLLAVSPWIIRVVGRTGMTAVTRMMGFIALSIGVQFIINGIGSVYGLIN